MERLCDVCGSKEFNFRFKIRHFRIISCTRCGFIFLNPAPERTPIEIYQEGYFTGVEYGRDSYNVEGWNYFDPSHLEEGFQHAAQALSRIEHFVSSGKVLDVGCGPGIFLSQAARRGWQVYGFDASGFAVRYAREKMGLANIRQLDVEEMDYGTQTFEAITMFHVIEHVLRPRKLIANCVKHLRPGGVLFIETPDIGTVRARKDGRHWRYIKIPEHLNYFSHGTLTMLLRQVGLVPVKTFRAVESTGLIVKMCGSGERAREFYNKWSEKTWFRTTVEYVRALKTIISGMLFKDYDIVTVIARKP